MSLGYRRSQNSRSIVTHILVMILTIVGVDLLLLQHHLWWRLLSYLILVGAFATVQIAFLWHRMPPSPR